MNERLVFGGLVGVVVVLLLVALFRPSPEPQVAEMTEEPVATAEASQEDVSPDASESDANAEPETGAPDQVAELTARIEELEAQLLAITEQTAQSPTSDDLAAIQSRVDEVAEDLGAKAADLSARLGAVQEQVVEAAQAVASAAPEVEEQAAAEAAPEETRAASEGGQGVGQTAVLADGALRVFVSRITEEGARLSINGKTVHLAIGERHVLPVGDDHCGIDLVGVDGGTAQLSSLCGDALPAPEGIGVGQTAILADGALRVFVSRVTQAEARLSINGQMNTLSPGRFVRVEGGDAPCRVTLDAIDRGHVLVDAACGAEAGVTGHTGPGKTAVLAEGAVRVFVSSVSDDEVRFAVNGQSMQSAAAGEEIALDNGCTLGVTEIADSGASFGLSCE